MVNYNKPQERYSRQGRTSGQTDRYSNLNRPRNRQAEDYNYDRDEDFENIYDESDYDEGFQGETDYENEFDVNQTGRGYQETGMGSSRGGRTSEQWRESDIEGNSRTRQGRQRQSSYGTGYRSGVSYGGGRGYSSERESYGNRGRAQRQGSFESEYQDEDINEGEQEYGYTGTRQGGQRQGSYSGYEGGRVYGSSEETGYRGRGRGRTSDYGRGTPGRTSGQGSIYDQDEYESERGEYGDTSGHERSERQRFSRSGRNSGKEKGRVGRPSGRQERTRVRRTS